MKHHFLKQLFCLTALVFYQALPAQESQAKDKTFGFTRELMISAGPAFTGINNENIKNDKYVSVERHIRPSLSVQYFLPTGPHLGYSFGLEYGHYTQTFIYRGYYRHTELREDKNRFKYYPLVETDYTDKYSFISADIPICLNLRADISKNIQVYGEAGVKLNAVLSYNSVRNGKLDKKGMYPLAFSGPNAYRIVENDATLGFVNTTYNNYKTNLRENTLAFGVLFNAGLKFRSGKNRYVSLLFSYTAGLSDLNDKTEKEYRNIFGDKSEHKPYTINQLVVRVGVVKLLW